VNASILKQGKMHQPYGVILAILAFALVSGLIKGQTCNNVLCKRKDITKLEDEIGSMTIKSENVLLGKISDLKRDIRTMTSKLEDDINKIFAKLSILETGIKNGGGEGEEHFFL
ncbi:unnamed protein product, partial [Owenia fusiformis]